MDPQDARRRAPVALATIQHPFDVRQEGQRVRLLAMGAAGTEVAIETADIALMTDDLLKIPEAIRLSKATLNNIRQNVVIALATVTLLLSGVLLGRVHMAGGMLIHEASVMIVILNGMRLLRA